MKNEIKEEKKEKNNTKTTTTNKKKNSKRKVEMQTDADKTILTNLAKSSEKSES